MMKSAMRAALSCLCLLFAASLALAQNFPSPDTRSKPGNLTHRPGGSQGDFQYNLNGSTTFGGSAVLSACAFSGANAGAQIINAIAALGTNGGTVDTRCFGTTTTQHITSTVVLANNQITLLVDRGTIFECDITNGTPCFEEEGISSIRGDGEAGAAGGIGFTLSSSADVSAVVEITSAGANGSLENVGITGNASATVTQGLVYLTNTGNILTIRGDQISAKAGETGIKMLDVYGPTYLENNYVDCGAAASACTPVLIESDGSDSGSHETTFIGGLYAHPGANGANPTPIFDVADDGANVNEVTWINTQCESSNTTDICYDLQRCAGCNIVGGEATAAAHPGNDIVLIADDANAIHIAGIQNTGSWTNTIKNTAASPNQSLTNANIVDYTWEGFVTNETVHTFTNGGTETLSSNGIIGAGVPLGSTPMSLASFPTCSSTTEGTFGRATNCSSAALGSTCSGTGSTHAEVECNGTNWVVWEPQTVGTGGNTDNVINVKAPAYGALGNGIARHDAAMSAIPTASGSSTTPTAGAVTTTVNNELVLSLFGALDTTWSAVPSVPTQRVNFAHTSGVYGMWAGDQAKATAGTVAAVSGTLSGANLWQAATLALISNGTNIAFNAATSAGQASGTTLTLTKPTGVTSGMFLLACIAQYNESATVAPNFLQMPSSWVNAALLVSERNVNASAGDWDYFQCWGRLAGSSEPSSYVFTQNANANSFGSSGMILSYSNVLAVDDALTSSSASFTSGDLNKLICLQKAAIPPTTGYIASTVQGQNQGNGQACGTITNIVSGTSIEGIFANSSGSSISGGQYIYATDDTTAINAAATQCATQGGGEIFLPNGIYGIQSISLPNTASCVLQGSGSALDNWGYSGSYGGVSGISVNNNNLGTMLDVLSTTQTSAGIVDHENANGVSANVFTKTYKDFTLRGGAGTAGDGGGSYGLDVQDAQRQLYQNVVVINFVNNNINEVLASGSFSYTDGLTFSNVWSLLSGADDLNLTAVTGISQLIQNVTINNGQFDNAVNAGIHVLGSITGFFMTGTNVQRNNINNYSSGWEIYLDPTTTGAILGGAIEGNYFESDTAQSNTVTTNTVTGWTGTHWGMNFFTQDLAGYTPRFSGSSTAAIDTNSTNLTSYEHQPPQCVTDAAACTAGTSYSAGGGSVACMVQSNGSAWKETGMGCY